MLCLVLLAPVVFGACASVPLAPVELDARTKTMAPPPDKALLYVYRGYKVMDRLYHVSIDGVQTAKFSRRSYLAWLLEPGTHELTLLDDDMLARRLPPLQLTIVAEAGKTYRVEADWSVAGQVPVLRAVDEREGRADMAGYRLALREGESDQVPVVPRRPGMQTAVRTAQPSAAAAAPAPSDVDVLPEKRVRSSRNAYAIVIGVERYRQKLPQAEFAARDARTVTGYLVKYLGYDDDKIVTLIDDHAGLGDFVKYFEKWLPNNVEPGASVFVYFSGHGAPNPATGDAYLVPYDGDPSFIDETGYPLRRMYDALGRLPAKEITVALDSCFSGAGGRSVLAKGARPIVLTIDNPVLLSKKITVLSASAGNQISSTYEEQQHGLFTYFLLKGIRDEHVVAQDGSLDVSSLYAYVKPQVSSIARKKYNAEQTPQLIGAKNN